jgi:hypothetical protein
MAIGNTSQLSITFLNSTIGDLATRYRNLCQDIIEFAQIVNQQGSSGLQGIGFDSASAATFLNATGHLLTPAQVYFGLVAQTPAFNFDITPDLIEARGGQIQ